MSLNPSTIPFALYRGGTSKAVFYHARDLPPPGKLRDRLLLRLMGSPDPIRIDGIGGAHPVTSKIAVISPSSRPGADVDYDFAQCSIRSNYISWEGGCGNISAAVGPFAIQEGLVNSDTPTGSGQTDEQQRTRVVKVWVVGLGNLLVAHVPINAEGQVIEKGQATIHGVSGAGAPIWLDYKETAGGACKKGLLPTGNPINHVTVRGHEIPATICDIANIMVFGRATDFGISGSEPATTLTENKRLIDDVREFRGRAAQMVGMCRNWDRVDDEAPNLPYVILLSEIDESGEGDVRVRLFLDNHCHGTVAGSGATCTTAAAKVQGTLVNQMAKSPVKEQKEFKVVHPMGHLPVLVQVKTGTGIEAGTLPEFEALSFMRTARKIAKGELSVPQDFDWSDGQSETNGLVNGH